MRSVAIVALLSAASCGGTSSSTTAPVTGPTPTTGDRLPWEAALTTGATFTLVEDGAEGREADAVTVKVTNVEASADQRVYSLDWGDHSGGPAKLVVRGTQVLVGDAEPAAMEDSWEVPGGIQCYAEDFSNPDGCEDVCEASLCLSTRGIVTASGLYTPSNMPYTAR